MSIASVLITKTKQSQTQIYWSKSKIPSCSMLMLLLKNLEFITEKVLIFRIHYNNQFVL
jgi:hypothetical protein